MNINDFAAAMSLAELEENNRQKSLNLYNLTGNKYYLDKAEEQKRSVMQYEYYGITSFLTK